MNDVLGPPGPRTLQSLGARNSGTLGPQAMVVSIAMQPVVRMRKPLRGFISRERRFRQVVSDFEWNHSRIAGCIPRQEVELGFHGVEQQVVVFHIGALGAFLGSTDTEHHP